MRVDRDAKPVIARLACAILPCALLAETRTTSAAEAETLMAQATASRITVVGTRHDDDALGQSDTASQGRIGHEELNRRPLLRPGELMAFVPGAVVTQHSGDGKANQYFLRGFNLDHGTDFASFLNGVPLNMPTHAHGQGYTDLNLLIPELVDHMSFRKGPYFAESGDFAAAGSAEFVYKTKLSQPLASVTLGQGNYQRWLAGGSQALGADLKLLGVIELSHNDGPWTVPEALHRTNAVLTLSGGQRSEGWQASLMSYQARWRATDQIPQRLLDPSNAAALARFGRYDSLDASTGGATQRTSLSAAWHRHQGDTSTRISAYGIAYSLDLYSNFTYALDRPETGDQFMQRDRRNVYGLSASHAVGHSLGPWRASTELGLQVRHDRLRVGLYDTDQRQILATTRDDTARLTQGGLWLQTSVTMTPWLRSVVGLRSEHASFRVHSWQQAENSGRAHQTLNAPKLSLIFGPWHQTEWFFNLGRGFHSNDARGTTAVLDPKTGEAVERVPALVAARGRELGVRTEWWPGLQSAITLWQLDTAAELVYVGDAGNTEAGRPSRRYGLEWNTRYRPRPWLAIDADLAWNHARYADPDPAGQRIPNAVERVASLAVTALDLNAWSISVQWRYFGSAALTEDNRLRSAPAIVTNLRISHAIHPKLTLSLDVFNLGNRQVNDIAYAYTSRLPGEAAPVSDIHLHPAEPRSLRLSLRGQW